MGLLGHALAGAAGGAAEGGIFVLKQQMEEAKLQRIAEFKAQLDDEYTQKAEDRKAERTTAEATAKRDALLKVLNTQGFDKLSPAEQTKRLAQVDPEHAMKAWEAGVTARAKAEHHAPMVVGHRGAVFAGGEIIPNTNVGRSVVENRGGGGSGSSSMDKYFNF
jgi:hypothetical protein